MTQLALGGGGESGRQTGCVFLSNSSGELNRSNTASPAHSPPVLTTPGKCTILRTWWNWVEAAGDDTPDTTAHVAGTNPPSLSNITIYFRTTLHMHASYHHTLFSPLT